MQNRRPRQSVSCVNPAVIMWGIYRWPGAKGSSRTPCYYLAWVQDLSFGNDEEKPYAAKFMRVTTKSSARRMLRDLWMRGIHCKVIPGFDDPVQAMAALRASEFITEAAGSNLVERSPLWSDPLTP